MENKSPIPIPAEIRNFFKDEYGKTFLIKGTPGSGKTVFALTLLSTLKRNGAYLSTRVDPDMLYMLYPWIKEKISADNIVDATQSERERRTKVKGETATIKPLKYTDVPDFLKAIYTRTEKMENPIIIIDSWDAVVSYTGHHEQNEREKLEHNLCDFSGKTGTTMIFIVEYVEQRPLDYMVDAVIATKSDMYEGRRLRSLSIQKLRGCSIKNPVSLFSLSNAVFKSFLVPKTSEIENPVIPDPIPDLTNGSISSGIKDFDMLIAGYAHFSLNIFEGEYTTYEILARALAINSLNLGRHIILTSTKQLEFINKILSFVKEEYRGDIEMVEDIKTLKERVKGDKGKFIAFLDLEEMKHVDEPVRAEISSIRDQGCVIMCYAGRDEGKGKEIEPIASIYIKTKLFSGIPCIYGEFPRTEIYAMELNTSDGFPVINIIPIE
jgi:KaiC/GvpD/RAD55 family RecA-like ATPase